MTPSRPELRSSGVKCDLAAGGEFVSHIPPHPGPLPEERGYRRLRGRQFRTPRVIAAQTCGLPLPKGEGWGEGKQSAPLPKSALSSHRLAKPEYLGLTTATLTASISI